ncbi:hypothetical protein EVAR_14420_1 [Eumeta japonica]|uniref:Myb-like domain-containing protein n=1 Tax=Eumeta variegata TaxID=151549 RepID=A0A4C1TXC9_EUMVA|nr:hypothetical protein EVAR_14420_1 [Eumeta japonica]
MDQPIVVKTEMGANEEILLFYVEDEEADANMENAITSENMVVEEIAEQNLYMTCDAIENVEENEDLQPKHYKQNNTKERWTEDEMRRLLEFYIENKTSFLSGVTSKKNLWQLASISTLRGKQPNACEMKLRNMKSKYLERRIKEVTHRNVSRNWPCYELCHQAFYDDPLVKVSMKEYDKPPELQLSYQKGQEQGIHVVKMVTNKKSTTDKKVETMLKLYLKHKKSSKNLYRDWQKAVWQNISLELGEDDPDYWHKRFLNYKQHYIGVLEKRDQNGPSSVQWPYMRLFDEIFRDDQEFQKKYRAKPKLETPVKCSQNNNDWNNTEMTVLVKYFYDCFDEFQDPTIPNKFLWNEVGRILDKNPEECRTKYEELKNLHLDSNNDGTYDLKNRIPLAIILDNIIFKEIDIEMCKQDKNINVEMKTKEIDEIVQFMYDNFILLKDPICHNVAWARVARKLNRSVSSCLTKWDELKLLYRNILTEKKENPDMEIDWRYIEMFDRIFDYGMDSTLLEEDNQRKWKITHEELPNRRKTKSKLELETENESEIDQNVYEIDDPSYYDDKDYGAKRRRRNGEPKAFAILDFYLQNKEKFTLPQVKKLSLWAIVGEQIDMSAEQCAHRFRNLKQVYMAYLQRECRAPDKPILWPYYNICKKIFGYKSLLQKIRTKFEDQFLSQIEWPHEDLERLLHYCDINYNEINKNINDKQNWAEIATVLGKSQENCLNKFLELKKTYVKLKTRNNDDPSIISWNYFKAFEDIYRTHNIEIEEEIGYDEPVESVCLEATRLYEEIPLDEDIRKDLQEDEDIQCIIVIPEDQDISEIDSLQANAGTVNSIVSLDNAETQIPTIGKSESTKIPTKWTKRTKKRLLINYLKYLKSHKNQAIIPSEMWKEIASKLPNKTPLSCRKVFAKLKNRRLNLKNEEVKTTTPYYTVLEKILAIKPKFVKKTGDVSLRKVKNFTDVPFPKQKLQIMLDYYLEHLEEFVTPAFNKKKAWIDLANIVGEPLGKVYNKMMYLKDLHKRNAENKSFDAIEEMSFDDLLTKVAEKEAELREEIDTQKRIRKESENEFDENENSWDEAQKEQLLKWYLENLEKFKNTKFVRSYLWQEASKIIGKNALSCSKMMAEIRTEYKNKIKDNQMDLENWIFYELCQKIYGTGKRIEPSGIMETGSDPINLLQ